MEISTLANLELNHLDNSLAISDEDVQTLVTKLHDLGFGYKYIPPSKSKCGPSLVFVDVYYKTPVMFYDDRGTKFLVPGYKKTETTKLSRKCSSMSISYVSVRKKGEKSWKCLTSVSYSIQGYTWEYNHKRKTLGSVPDGMKTIYEFGKLSDFIDVIVESFAKLKEYIDNGTEYPVKK